MEQKAGTQYYTFLGISLAVVFALLIGAALGRSQYRQEVTEYVESFHKSLFWLAHILAMYVWWGSCFGRLIQAFFGKRDKSFYTACTVNGIIAAFLTSSYALFWHIWEPGKARRVDFLIMMTIATALLSAFGFFHKNEPEAEPDDPLGFKAEKIRKKYGKRA